MRGEEVAAGELREHLQEEEKHAYIHIHVWTYLHALRMSPDWREIEPRVRGFGRIIKLATPSTFLECKQADLGVAVLFLLFSEHFLRKRVQK